MIKSKSVRTMLFFTFSTLIFLMLFYIFLNFNKPVTIVVDGIEITTRTNSNTVEDVLDENNIVVEEGGNIFPSKYSKISRGEKIILENPFPVVLYLGNMDPSEVMTTSKTVGDFLVEQGIEIDENDIVIPSVDTKVVPGIDIKIKYVDIKVESEAYDVEYKTQIKHVNDLYVGEERLVREGKNGLRLVKREKRYENGFEVDSKVVYDNIEVQPIDKILEIGTKKREVVNVQEDSLEMVSRAYSDGSKFNFLGKDYSVAYTKSVESTAFYNSGSNGNHTTATGNSTVYNPSGWSTIAVDPRVIPLNTKVYVEGYGFAMAHDTGGAIKGNIIDVFMPSREAAYRWGRKKGVKIYILE